MSAEPAGSIAEEAAKLIAALQAWAQEQMPRPDGDAGIGPDLADHDLNGHDPLSPECRYCPLCALARMAKATTPEVRDHLSSAALSLAMAFKGLLDNAAPTSTESTPVEKIDLAED